MALAAGIFTIFAAGVFLGKRMASSANDSNTKPPSEQSHDSRARSNHLVDASPSSGKAEIPRKKAPYDPEQEAVLAKIRKARLNEESTRIRQLTHVLEETKNLELTKALLDELRSIVSEGEQQSSHFVLSLMEQREDKAAVAFLLETASHPNADIADRALFALEAVAGKVFNDRTEAAAWASTWQPEEDRVRLFAPNQAQANDDFTSGVPRDVSPVRKEPSNQVPDQ